MILINYDYDTEKIMRFIMRIRISKYKFFDFILIYFQS